VLVVDDNQEDRMLLMDFLSQQGCRVYIAQDGRDGYTKARTVQPDLILMDIRMPVCDGLGACRLLKADPGTRQIPLIFLTAAALPGERVAGLSAGAVDYVTKPYDFEEVRLRLSIHLKAGTPAPAPSVDESDAALGVLPVQAHTLDAVLFRATRALLLGRLDTTPELAGLASAVGTNTRRLNLAFRRCVGVTVFDFLREERMKEARRLLSETSLDVQDIAAAVGFSSAANFATAFRERFGMPPSGFREQGTQAVATATTDSNPTHETDPR
jgi:CheY-like chemotaxis protein